MTDESLFLKKPNTTVNKQIMNLTTTQLIISAQKQKIYNDAIERKKKNKENQRTQ